MILSRISHLHAHLSCDPHEGPFAPPLPSPLSHRYSHLLPTGLLYTSAPSALSGLARISTSCALRVPHTPMPYLNKRQSTTRRRVEISAAS